MIRIFAAAVLVLVALLSSEASAAETIRVDNAQSRAMLPGTNVGGGYLSVTNTGPESDTLLAVTSNRAKSVQLHRMRVENGIMIMRELKEGIEIPAGGTVVFKPGAYHLMFVGVTERFKRGETIKATLTFAKAGAVEVAFAVGSAGGDMSAPTGAANAPASGNAMPGMDMGGTDRPAAETGKGTNASGMEAMPGMQDANADPEEAIRQVMREQFETADKPVTTDPIVMQSDWAIVGWQQDGRGGRVLLKKGPHGYATLLGSGDSLKDPASLVGFGVDEADAKVLADRLSKAESILKPETVALFSSFVGTVKLDRKTGGQADHSGHGQ